MNMHDNCTRLHLHNLILMLLSNHIAITLNGRSQGKMHTSSSIAIFRVKQEFPDVGTASLLDEQYQYEALIAEDAVRILVRGL